MVNHPDHYLGDYTCKKCGCPIEAIDVCRHMNFNLGNVLKYIWRAGKKHSTTSLEDLKKAEWYIKNEIEKIEEQSEKA